MLAGDELNVMKLEDEKSMAMAVRMGNHADKDEWRKYIKRK